MTAKHTTGPWELDASRSPGRITSTAGPAYSIANVYLTDPVTRKRDEQYLANAHLIAAAPDLLAALKVLLPAIDAEIEQRQHSGNDEDWSELWALSTAAHLAVRKAEWRA